ncbi:low affinity copper uptake protein 2 [Trichonephila inaurata madagascariensis]|uniref:Copper transport protein n=1 Tax=Trichonephila inaurata madagascariensis TaxID=2747483 RepID=A0A8X7C4L9_9ARAC|nr:low affinity copper uptake protein 2 [Trichonephila inaurata madagascariensis]
MFSLYHRNSTVYQFLVFSRNSFVQLICRRKRIMGDFKNYFTFSNHVQHLLFKNVTVSSDEGMLGLCVGVAVFTFVFEAIKSLRHYLVILQMKRRTEQSELSADKNKREKGALTSLNPPSKRTEKLKFHCLQTLLHMLQLTLGYMVMLIIMSYNAWLLITVVITTALCFYFHEYVLSRKSLILPMEIPGSNL